MSHRTIASSLAALSCSFVLAAAPAHAQEGGDDVTLDDLQKSAEELGREFERQKIEFEKTGAYLGGTEPWPRPDPEYVVPTWSEAVLAAERLTAAEVLERSETVKLSLARNAPALALFEDERDLIGAGVEAVIAAGRHTDANSELKLHMVVALGNSIFNFTRGGAPGGSEDVHYLQAIVTLVLPARVLRGSAVQQVPLVLANTVLIRFWPDAPGRSEVAQAMQDAAQKLFDLVPSVSETAPVGPGVWGPWIGDLAQSNQRFDEWNASFHSGSQKLGPALDTVPGFRELRPWAEYYRPHWTSGLGANGFSTGLLGAPDLVVEMFFNPYEGPGRLNGGGVRLCRTSVLERDAVAVLGGRYVRVAGASLVDVSFPRFASTASEGELTAEVQQLAIREFLAELGHGRGGAGQVRHENADLVANFLRTRERLPLPKGLVDDVSNKIALALAGATDIPASQLSEWKTTRDGVEMIYLPWVGGARSAELVPRGVKQAAGRVIKDLTRADALGLYAFDRPFFHDGSRGSRATLPERFIELLTDRPMGAGGLQLVYVDTASSPVEKLAGSARGILAGACEDQRIMVCHYTPNAGDMDPYTVRYFWYETEPDGWGEIVKALPEMKLDRIGPARELPPKYVSEADVLIAR